MSDARSMAPMPAPVSLALNDQVVFVVHRAPRVDELAVSIDGVNDGLVVAIGVDHELPRPAPVFALLQKPMEIAALPTPGPPFRAGNGFVDGTKEAKLFHFALPQPHR